MVSMNCRSGSASVRSMVLPSARSIANFFRVTSLLRQLKLPLDERGRRRAANRAEWFGQLDKPLEVHDIFGAA